MAGARHYGSGSLAHPPIPSPPPPLLPFSGFRHSKTTLPIAKGFTCLPGFHLLFQTLLSLCLRSAVQTVFVKLLADPRSGVLLIDLANAYCAPLAVAFESISLYKEARVTSKLWSQLLSAGS